MNSATARLSSSVSLDEETTRSALPRFSPSAAMSTTACSSEEGPAAEVTLNAVPAIKFPTEISIPVPFFKSPPVTPRSVPAAASPAWMLTSFALLVVPPLSFPTIFMTVPSFRPEASNFIRVPCCTSVAFRETIPFEDPPLDWMSRSFPSPVSFSPPSILRAVPVSKLFARTSTMFPCFTLFDET